MDAGGLGSPVLLDEADEPEAPPSAARPAAGAGAMTPTSPFALGEMFGRRGGGGGGGGAGGAGAGAAGGDAPGTGASVRLLDLDLTPDESMQKKWGFTPGADDTLDVSHGAGLARRDLHHLGELRHPVAKAPRAPRASDHRSRAMPAQAAR